MKRLILFITGTVVIVTLGSAAWYLSKFKTGNKDHTPVTLTVNNKLFLAMKAQAADLSSFAKQNGYNTKTCFLVNMNIASGKNRFFVYDLQKDSILNAGLVTHGRCNKTWLTGRQYGNKPGCGCTSLGRYKIGNPYQGRFGLAYKLHGLDSTNNNAFKRYVVLHAHDCVPGDEVDPYPICQSDGCPTVSQGFLKKLAAVINASQQPVLLCIFE